MTVRSDPGELSIAIVGRPNAGKSSLVNRFLKEERMIVSEMPGTTRDTVDSMLTWHRRRFRIVDTAGIRKAGRVARGGQVETLSVMLARRAILAADIVVLVVDASVGVTDQDAAIAGEADKAGRGIIIAANKWDLMKDRGSEFVKVFDEELRRQLKFLDYAPVLHVSAATGERTPKLLEAIDRVATSRATRVKTPAAQHVREEDHGCPPAGQSRTQSRAGAVRRPDRGVSADLRAVHQRGHGVPFLVRAVSAQQAAGEVRLRGHAAAAARPASAARGTACGGRPQASERCLSATGCYTVAGDPKAVQGRGGL